MSQTTLSVRMDEDVKRRFDRFCAEVGMNASTAVNMFARATLRENQLPFVVKTAPKPAEPPEPAEPTKKLILKSELADDSWIAPLVGILKNIPDDADVREIVTEERWKKYESLT
ncbi:MAG: type II toxin-antitoxin system RelB/DinJ family antitoxin [Turicibacter sp.]|nr:type II toxin-antitoxin system RelB/DinJ family antitoxin [Turicibacter sp.]